jgi:diacylglycerol kinase (ATP)
MTPDRARPVAVLLNPAAGRGRHRGSIAGVLAALRSAGHPVEVVAAGSGADAEAAGHKALVNGAAALVAVGGDGTLHLALQSAAASGVPFGIVPAGTGNDFAVQMGLPVDPVAAAKRIAESLAEGRTRPVDLGRVTGRDGSVRWYAAVLAAGFDAIVNERANAMRWPRGPLRYDLATYVELAKLRPRRYTLTLDGVVHELDAVLVAVGNTASYGGGMRITPHAEADDGLLDVVVAGPISRATLVRLKPRLYAGTHVEHPQCSTYRASTVELASDRPIVTYVDGERGHALPVRITAESGALSLLA